VLGLLLTHAGALSNPEDQPGLTRRAVAGHVALRRFRLQRNQAAVNAVDAITGPGIAACRKIRVTTISGND